MLTWKSLINSLEESQIMHNLKERIFKLSWIIQEWVYYNNWIHAKYTMSVGSIIFRLKFISVIKLNTLLTAFTTGKSASALWWVRAQTPGASLGLNVACTINLLCDFRQSDFQCFSFLIYKIETKQCQLHRVLRMNELLKTPGAVPGI